jgi:hypothetical protein
VGPIALMFVLVLALALALTDLVFERLFGLGHWVVRTTSSTMVLRLYRLIRLW